MSPCIQQNARPGGSTSLTSGAKSRSRLALFLLVTSLALGAWLRLSALDRKSISHPEMYVPGIHLAEGTSEPAQRLTLAAVLTGTFSSDTHPPGFYLFVWPWTKVFGTGLKAIRLPSALLGTACIPLLFWLGSLIGRKYAGAIASALLAFHGYHVLWSRVARMFALASFLGLLATVLLLLIVNQRAPRRLCMVLYTLVILAGVSTHVFFWALFAAHIAWCLLKAAMQPGALPDICRLQLLSLITGTPLIAFAAYQSANTVATLSDELGFFWWHFSSFAFLFPNQQSGIFPEAPAGVLAEPGFWLARAFLLLLALGLLFLGLRSVAVQQTSEPATKALPASQQAGSWSVVWILSALAATLAIVLFILMTRALPADRVNPTLRLTKILAASPLLCAAASIWLQRRWPSRRELRPGFWGDLLRGNQALVVILATVPAGLVSLVSLVRPFLNQRGMLFVGPYMLLVIAFGITALPRRVSVFAPLVIILAGAYGLSLHAYAPKTVDPTDYTQFAVSLQSQARSGDLIFVRKAWYATPILYYLPPERYHIAARNFSKECLQHPKSRIWTVLLHETDVQPEIQQALAGYQVKAVIEAPDARAALYEPADRQASSNP
jgi:hypothetical protein